MSCENGHLESQPPSQVSSDKRNNLSALSSFKWDALFTFWVLYLVRIYSGVGKLPYHVRVPTKHSRGNWLRFLVGRGSRSKLQYLVVSFFGRGKLQTVSRERNLVGLVAKYSSVGNVLLYSTLTKMWHATSHINRYFLCRTPLSHARNENFRSERHVVHSKDSHVYS